MRKILFWFDYNVVLPIARRANSGEKFMAFLKETYPEQFQNELEYERQKKGSDMKCPNCGGTVWNLYDSIDDLSMNVECAKCKDRYNYTFGSYTFEPYKKIK